MAVCVLGCTPAPRARELSRFDRQIEPGLRLFLVRHGEAYKNLPEWRRPSGLSDDAIDSLTPTGKEQAAALGRYFKARNVVAVLASPTGRTRQTAQAICDSIGIASPTEAPAFAPIRNGTTPDGEKSSWGWLKEQWLRGEDPRPEGGENLRDLVARTVAAVEGLVGEYRGGTIVLVTHGEVIAALLGHAEATPLLSRSREHQVATGSLSEVELFAEPRWRADSQSVVPARD
jgi:broad specificity phosphatase PhoE